MTLLLSTLTFAAPASCPFEATGHVSGLSSLMITRTYVRAVSLDGGATQTVRVNSFGNFYIYFNDTCPNTNNGYVVINPIYNGNTTDWSPQSQGFLAPLSTGASVTGVDFTWTGS